MLIIIAEVVEPLPSMQQVTKYVNHAAAPTIVLMTSIAQEESASLTASVELTLIALIRRTSMP